MLRYKWEPSDGEVLGPTGYSSFGIAINRKHAFKWLFHHRGPRRRVLVAGVEEKVTFHCAQKVYVNSETALTHWYVSFSMNSRVSIAVHILTLLASTPGGRVTSEFIALS